MSRFEPSERGSDWFALESLDLRGSTRPAVGLVGEYQYRPLVIYNGDGSVRNSIVGHAFIVHPGASFVFADRLRLAVSLPIQAYATGDGGVLGGTFYAPPTNEQSIGDLRLGADVRLLGTYGDAFTLAAGVQAWLPTGDRDSYAGDGAIRFAPRVTAAGDIGKFVYAAKLGAQYRYHEVTFGGSPVGNEFQYAASLGLRPTEKAVVGLELFGSTILDGDQLFARRTTPLEGLVGFHWLTGQVRVGAGVGTGITRGYGTPLVHVLGSLEWAPGIDEDSDKDGVLDKDDACPQTPGVASADPHTNGCPPDRDKDGILDSDDVCPDDPGISTNDPKTHGCPDSDKDGIFDRFDACITVPGVASEDPKKNGCPVEELDRDKDGVLDKDDACPDVPGLKTADPKTNGCPDPDRDKDNIPNDTDACPDAPGPQDSDPKRNGCPKAFVQDGQIRILDQVKFKTNSAEILPGAESLDVLNAVLNVLTQHADIKRVRVEGHTDNRGDAKYNKGLSANRAATVVKWLTAHGVEAARLTSEGFGQDKPIDTNDTDAGRKQNRRVEFHISEETKP